MIQVLGPRGMLGQAVVAAAYKQDIPCIDFRYGDICDWIPLAHRGAVINCVGVTPQGHSLPSQFMHANATGPRRIAELCNAYDLRLIHVSTDCVFQDPGPHAEDDPPNATSIYALSKRAGEVTNPPHLTVRTSFVGEQAQRYGAKSLVDTLRYGTPVKASKNLLWSGHTVWTVANILVQLALRPTITGLLHIPGDFQSRAQLVDRLQARLGTAAPVIYDDSFVADRRLISNRWAKGCPDLTPPSFDRQLETWGHV